MYKNKLIVLISLLSFSSFLYSAEYKGILSYSKAIDLSSPTTGVIEKVSSTGSFFKKYQTLLSFDKMVIKSQVSALKSKLLLQQKIYSEAQREFQRSKELYDGTMLSVHELKMAEIGELQEKSSLDSIKSQLLKSEWELKYFNLKAPFDGFMVGKITQAGQFVNNRFKAIPLIKFVAAQEIEISITLRNNQLSSESKIMDLKVGDKVKIKEKSNKEENTYLASFISFTEQQNNKIFVFRLMVDESAYKSLTLPLEHSSISLVID